MNIGAPLNDDPPGPMRITVEFDQVYDSSILQDYIESYRRLNKQLKDYEEEIKNIESDINLLCQIGKNLYTQDTRKKFNEICKEFEDTYKLDEIRQTIKKLYNQRAKYIEDLYSLNCIDDSISVSCPVCFSKTVHFFNENCGHTFCENCAFFMSNCAICRGPLSYKKLMFSA
jgi:uncharacterized protein YllA (UPF0747 family)